MTTAFSRTFKVGPRSVTIAELPGFAGLLAIRWTPEAPDSLTPEEWNTYQQRRNQVLSTMAIQTDRMIVVTDHAPFTGGCLQMVQASPNGQIDVVGSTTAETNPKARTAKELTQAYLMAIADHIVDDTVGTTDTLRCLLNGIRAIADTAGIEPAALKDDPGFAVAIYDFIRWLIPQGAQQ